MNKAQEFACDRFRGFLNRDIKQENKYGTKITKFETTETTYGAVWISAEVEHTALSEDNLLRALDHQYWHVLVGKQGGLTVRSCPRSFEQFHAKRAFGMAFKVKTTRKDKKSLAAYEASKGEQQ